MNTEAVRPEKLSTEGNPNKDTAFWGICLGHTFTHWYPATFYILLPLITVQFGLSVGQAGLLVTIMYLVKAIAGMPIGAITDMTTKKNLLMLLSLILAGLPFLFLGFVNAYWMIMLLVIIMGIGNEMWHPASFSTLSSLYPKQRGYVFGVHGMSANLGDLLAPVIIGTVLTFVSWQDVVYFNIIPAIVVGIVIAFMLRNIEVTSNKGIKKENGEKLTFPEYMAGFKELLKNKAVLLIALASGMRSMTQLGLMTFLPIFLLLELGYSPFLVGLYITVMQAGGLIAAPLMGKLSDNVGRRKIIFSGMIITSVLVVAVVFIQIDWLLITTLAILGFFLYSLRPVMQAWIMSSTKKSMSGTTTSLLFTTQSMLAALTPLIGGMIADSIGIMYTFYFIALIILLGNIVVAFIPKTAAD
ncbi:MFS transporter [Halalkalibacterium ligniniphilum]|uniref:MFS transporter n=1 Tax=Halalkalibacterium ligniniphilum TaxID=1134413 RepID=UPI000346A313|nr:MFS transporter [Halalkalibacterium ligniniphilum]